MKRAIDQELVRWKTSAKRRPLIIRGARQVGKSFTIEQLGKNEFESISIVNFENRPEFIGCFNTLDPKEIVSQLEVFLDQKIVQGKTLLFFDEIQECPRAITALRYFKEQMPDLHVIAAGSLLEFALNDDHFSFPVGRVQFMYMKPMSFIEFLEAIGRQSLIEQLHKISLKKPPSEAIHQEFLKYVHLYFLIGGMPEVIDTYRKEHSLLSCRRIQEMLLSAYKKDFGKYAPKTQHKYLQRIFEQAPHYVANNVRYSKIDPEASNPAREYKHAIQLLTYAGLIKPIVASAANGIPLEAEVNEKKFKLLFLDIGLLTQAMHFSPEAYTGDSLRMINQGAVTEQLVGQELLAYEDPYFDTHLYFWEREKLGSSAQVDYLTTIDSKIFPIEVKASRGTHLKSIKLFMAEKKCSLGIKISEEELHVDNNIITVPFYLISQLPRLVKEIPSGGM